jgi:flavin-dependent dehydrogenase
LARTPRSTTFDALVAGAGPAGAAAALTLARRGQRVLLADQRPARPPDGGVEIGEALPPAVRPLLADLGLWDRFLAARHLPSPGTVSVWGSPREGSVDFIFDPNGHGWHLDRPAFDRLLARSARDAGAELRENCAARVLERASDGRWQVELHDAAGPRETVECRVLLDATGRRATLARRAGARRLRADRAVAVYAAFAAHPDDRDARTLVEAAPDGWWYTALVPAARRVVAYVTDADLLPATTRTRAGFRAQLGATKHVRKRVPAASQLAPQQHPRVTAAHGSRLQPATGAGWLALGDAALAFDPLSSQGILTALFTGIAAANAAAAQIAGEHGPTREYARRLDLIWSAYERNRLAHYQLERRWAQRSFWARRSRPPDPAD